MLGVDHAAEIQILTCVFSRRQGEEPVFLHLGHTTFKVLRVVSQRYDIIYIVGTELVYTPLESAALVEAAVCRCVPGESAGHQRCR